jgi:two-component system phosphate regulon sensor histidine kinase PhoR
LVSQLSDQTKNELNLIKTNLKRIGFSGPEWCLTIDDLVKSNYMVFKKNGELICKNQNHLDDVELITNFLFFPTDKTSFLFQQKKSSISNEFYFLSKLNLDDDLIILKLIPDSLLKIYLDQFDKTLFLRIVPLSLLSYLIFIILFYRSTIPLAMILSRLQKFKDEIPLKENIELLYKKDEWSSIEAALNKADLKLQEKILEIQTENEKNNAILESINDDIIAIDRFESILFHNSKFNKNFMTHRDGREIHKKIWHLFDHQVLDAFRLVLLTGETQSLRDISFPEGRHPNKIFDLKVTPLMLNNGTVHGALGIFYDVTEFKLAEKMRVDFVANVSHEIRTPLTSIKGFSQILLTQRGKVDIELQPFLEKIVVNTERMISLFNDLLNLSVIESRDHLRCEEISLQSISDVVEGNIKASYPKKEINFEYNLKVQSIKGDTRLFEQVFLNLCDNACKYSQDTVQISISSFNQDGKCQILIKDDGPGISTEHLPRIFERFYRIDASREGLRGTGLGLSIVKQIISKHKGRIWAESEGMGKGTIFKIELPLQE